jgi:hypothetical protein
MGVALAFDEVEDGHARLDASAVDPLKSPQRGARFSLRLLFDRRATYRAWQETRLWFLCSDNTHSVPGVHSNIIALIIHVDQMMSVGN